MIGRRKRRSALLGAMGRGECRARSHGGKSEDLEEEFHCFRSLIADMTTCHPAPTSQRKE
jgi:hypothetical protein